MLRTVLLQMCSKEPEEWSDSLVRLTRTLLCDTRNVNCFVKASVCVKISSSQFTKSFYSPCCVLECKDICGKTCGAEPRAADRSVMLLSST